MNTTGRRLDAYAGFLLTAFLLSGAAALIYQIVWVRMLVLVFGATSYAVATVLVAFMSGLALGGWGGGAVFGKTRHPSAGYLGLQILMAAYALAFPALQRLMLQAFVRFSGDLAHGSLLLQALRFALSFVSLIVPTTLMGATLPAMCRLAIRHNSAVTQRFPLIYGVNTLGSVIGSLVAGFFLIEAVGLRGALVVGAAVNVIAGVLVMVRRPSAASTEADADDTPATANVPLASYATPLLVMLAFVSGFSTLAYEVLWTKRLVWVLGTTTYAFSTLLATILIGLVAGSLWVGRHGQELKHPMRALAWIQAAIGLLAVGLVFVFNAVPIVDRGLLSPSWSSLVTVRFAFALLLLIVPSFLAGVSFPLASVLFLRTRTSVARSAGMLYAVNSVGCILGSFLAGFVLVPLIGIAWSCVAVALLNMLTGAVLGFTAGARRSGGIMLAATAALLLCLGLNPDAVHMRLLNFKDVRTIYRKEGPTGVVEVWERKDDPTQRGLYIDGDPAASTAYSALRVQRLQGMIPLLCHPLAKSGLVICFGTGSTLGTLTRFPLEQIHCVDISREVISAADLFERHNYGAHRQERTTVFCEDGRNFLLRSTNRYDLITAEPMHPSLAGVVNLYTREYYELYRSHLKEGAYATQWAPTQQIGEADYRTIIRTFLEVFPHSTLWYSSTAAIIVGRKGMPIEFDPASVAQRMAEPTIAESLAEISIDGLDDLLECFFMDEAALHAYAGDGPILSDMHPTIEYSTPRAVLADDLDNLVAMQPHLVSPVALLAAPEQADEALQARLDMAGRARDLTLTAEMHIDAGLAKKGLGYLQQARSAGASPRYLDWLQARAEQALQPASE